MGEDLRIGLIGAGADHTWAARAHVPALAAIPDMTIAAVATTRVESARAAADATGATHAFTDALELVNHPNVDVVAVVVRVTAHYPLVSAAVAAGKHVYCEWPLGADIHEARDLHMQAHKAEVCHMIGLQGRQSPQLLTARDLIADGAIGRVLSVDARHSTGHRGGPTVAAGDVWGLDRRAGRNLLTIQGGHVLDSLCFVLDRAFTSTSSLVATRTSEATVIETGKKVPVDSPDQVVVAGELEDEIVVSVHLQGGAPHLDGFSMDVHGDRGAIRLSGPGAHNSDLELVLCTEGREPRRLPPSTRHLPAVVGNLPNPAGNVARQYVRFAEQIRGADATGPSFDDAVAVHEVLLAIDEAATTGRRRKLTNSAGRPPVESA